jgi:hypothetical protein
MRPSPRSGRPTCAHARRIDCRAMARLGRPLRGLGCRVRVTLGLPRPPSAVLAPQATIVAPASGRLNYAALGRKPMLLHFESGFVQSGCGFVRCDQVGQG